MKLVYLSPVMWESYYQRPHYMVQYFLNLSAENSVLWINPYPTRLPCLSDFNRKKQKIKSNSIVLDRLSVCSIKALPIEPFKYSENINNFLFWKKIKNKIKDFWGDDSSNNKLMGIGKPSKFAFSALTQFGKIKSFYDAMDDFPEFYQGLSHDSMKNVERKISEQVDSIIVSSSHLLEKFPNAIKIINGYPMSTLPLIEEKVRNHQINRKVIFGYVGTIGKWFDWKLVIQLANLFPQDCIKLVGPEYIFRPNNLPYNIEFYPECSQAQAVSYLKNFDVGIIPFIKNSLTQSVDPIKYYEYRGMGLPIISSKFGEMINKENIIYFEELNKSVKDKINKKNTIEEIMNFRNNNDWSTRFVLLDKLFSNDYPVNC